MGTDDPGAAAKHSCSCRKQTFDLSEWVRISGVGCS